MEPKQVYKARTEREALTAMSLFSGTMRSLERKPSYFSNTADLCQGMSDYAEQPCDVPAPKFKHSLDALFRFADAVCQRNS